jgi:hypothetical protein
MMRYVYIGSKTAQALVEQGFDVELRKGQVCDPVRHADGRVIRCTDAGIANALVRFRDGTVKTVSPRRLRLLSKLTRVYLVACSKSKCKAPKKRFAKDMYASDLFKKSRRYVQLHRSRSDKWFILSAKYRLLHPRRPILRYDATLNDMSARERRQWSKRTSDMLLRRLDERTHIVILAGKRYREHLIPRLRAEGHPSSVPMRGLGIGEQKAWLIEQTE